MSISKRGYSLRVRVRDRNGEQHTETIKGKKGAPARMGDAKELERLMIKMYQSNDYGLYPDYTIGELLTLWLNQKTAPRYASHNHYTQMEEKTRNHIRPVLGDIKLSQLSVRDVTRMIDRALTHRYDRKLKKHVPSPDKPPKTRNAELAVAMLLNCLNHHVEKEQIAKNPMKGKLAKLLPESDKGERPYLSEEEVAEIIKNCEYSLKVRDENNKPAIAHRVSEFREALILSSVTGMRRGEILALTWRDVDDLGLKINVDKNWTRFEELKKTKGKEKRTIAVGPKTGIMLREHREEMKKFAQRRGIRFNLDTPVFMNEDGQRYKTGSFSQAFQRAKERAGAGKVRQYATLHDLRHYHASVLMDSDEHSRIKMISERLGHKDVAFTLDQYGHLLSNADEEAAAWSESKVNAIFEIEGRKAGELTLQIRHEN